MENSRQKIKTFISDNFQDHELKHKSTVTREIEPKLKYFMVDRYTPKVISPESLYQLISFVNTLWDVEAYFAFNYLCIGYTDNEFGNAHNCMRLDAFVPGQPVDIPDQADKDFVTPVLHAAAEIQDKATVQQPDILQARKGFRQEIGSQTKPRGLNYD